MFTAPMFQCCSFSFPTFCCLQQQSTCYCLPSKKEENPNKDFMRSASWKRIIRHELKLNLQINIWHSEILSLSQCVITFPCLQSPLVLASLEVSLQVNQDSYLQHNLTLTTVGVPQVRDEDKSSYVAEWASKHAFGPPSPQADHHGESWEDLDEKVLDFEEKQWLPPSGPPSPLTTTSSLSCKSRRKLPATPHSLPTHSPEVVLLWSEQTLRSNFGKLVGNSTVNSSQSGNWKWNWYRRFCQYHLGFCKTLNLFNCNQTNSKPTSLHVHSYLYQPH